MISVRNLVVVSIPFWHKCHESMIIIRRKMFILLNCSRFRRFCRPYNYVAISKPLKIERAYLFRRKVKFNWSNIQRNPSKVAVPRTIYCEMKYWSVLWDWTLFIRCRPWYARLAKLSSVMSRTVICSERQRSFSSGIFKTKIWLDFDITDRMQAWLWNIIVKENRSVLFRRCVVFCTVKATVTAFTERNSLIWILLVDFVCRDTRRHWDKLLVCESLCTIIASQCSRFWVFYF